MTGKVFTPLLSINLNIRKMPVELRMLSRRLIIGDRILGSQWKDSNSKPQGQEGDLNFKLFLDFVNLDTEPLIGFDQVIDRFAGVKHGGMVLSADL
jgi:hypothetical protein